MEKPVKGNIVVVPFPFSDLSSTKRRPALVVSVLEGDGLILVQITSRDRGPDKYSINLDKEDFTKGHLNIPSYIKPNKIFTADNSLILYTIGQISQKKLSSVLERICEIVKD